MQIDKNTAQMAWEIWKLSQQEPEYKKMLTESRELEKEFEDAVTQLPYQQEMAVRDFLAHCEAMSWYMLQIACAVMHPTGIEDV